MSGNLTFYTYISVKAQDDCGAGHITSTTGSLFKSETTGISSPGDKIKVALNLASRDWAGIGNCILDIRKFNNFLM